MNYPIMNDPVPGDPTALQAWARTYSDMANSINDVMTQLDGVIGNLIGAGPGEWRGAARDTFALWWTGVKSDMNSMISAFETTSSTLQQLAQNIQGAHDIYRQASLIAYQGSCSNILGASDRTNTVTIYDGFFNSHLDTMGLSGSDADRISSMIYEACQDVVTAWSAAQNGFIAAKSRLSGIFNQGAGITGPQSHDYYSVFYNQEVLPNANIPKVGQPPPDVPSPAPHPVIGGGNNGVVCDDANPLDQLLNVALCEVHEPEYGPYKDALEVIREFEDAEPP